MASDPAVAAASKLIDGRYGILQEVNVALSLPDEPAIFTTEIERAHPDELTDGHPMEPHEGGCSLDKDQAILSGIGEAVERYSACIYRDESIQTARYEDLDNAVDPAAVTNFHSRQIDAGEAPSALYDRGDEVGWVETTHLGTGVRTMVPAQLVYLNYDRGDEPFIRNPISTGLAASMSKQTAIARGTLEVVERDAFMIYYLTRTELPRIVLDDRPEPIDELVDRIDRAGIDWHLLDARTDLGLPVVIAVLVDDEVPSVTVGVAASNSAVDAVRDALEESLQIRLYQRHLTTGDGSPIDLETAAEGDIGRDARLRGWAKEGMESELTFWTESDRKELLTTISDESDVPSTEAVPDVVSETLNQYVVELTTRDVEACGFSVVRVIAPDAHPLYLMENYQYLDARRLESVPESMGHANSGTSPGSMNTYPHPFA